MARVYPTRGDVVISFIVVIFKNCFSFEKMSFFLKTTNNWKVLYIKIEIAHLKESLLDLFVTGKKKRKCTSNRELFLTNYEIDTRSNFQLYFSFIHLHRNIEKDNSFS